MGAQLVALSVSSVSARNLFVGPARRGLKLSFQLSPIQLDLPFPLVFPPDGAFVQQRFRRVDQHSVLLQQLRQVADADVLRLGGEERVGTRKLGGQ